MKDKENSAHVRESKFSKSVDDLARAAVKL